MSFEDKPIPRLSKYYFIFWNRGKQTLNGSDIQKQDPLTLEFDEGTEILDVRQLNEYKEKKIIDFNHSKLNNKLFLNFNYLDHNQGFTLEILTTGEEPYPKSISGTIKGVPSGIKSLGVIIPESFDLGIMPEYLKKLPFKKFSFILTAIFLYGLILFIPQLILLIISPQTYMSLNNLSGVFMLVVSGGFTFWIVWIELVVQRKKCPEQLKIKDFEVKI